MIAVFFYVQNLRNPISHKNKAQKYKKLVE